MNITYYSKQKLCGIHNTDLNTDSNCMSVSAVCRNAYSVCFVYKSTSRFLTWSTLCLWNRTKKATDFNVLFIARTAIFRGHISLYHCIAMLFSIWIFDQCTLSVYTGLPSVAGGIKQFFLTTRRVPAQLSRLLLQCAYDRVQFLILTDVIFSY